MSLDFEGSIQNLIKAIYYLDNKIFASSDALSAATNNIEFKFTVSELDAIRPFAIKKGLLFDSNGYKITDKGKALAVKLINDAYESANPIQPIEVFNFIDSWLEALPKFGEFSCATYEPDSVMVYSNVEGVLGELKKRNEVRLRDAAIQHMIFDGFAINRHDIGKGGKVLYRELTDKGRTLKSKGSLSAYREWEYKEKELEERRKLLTDKVLELNIDNIAIQVSQMWFNFWIATGTIITCLFTADNLIRDQYNSIYPFYHQYALPFCVVFAPVLLALRLALKLRRKRNTPSSL